MKKLLSLFLILTLVISAFAISSLSAAAENSDAPVTVPRITVTTASGLGTLLQKTNGYVDATITITDTDGSVLTDSVQFKVRGNSTALVSVTKKAYTFKFEKKKDVLGMGKAKKWALLANAFDPTLMRNYIAFDLAREMGLDYTSEHRYVELWLDGSFRGCYQLIEPIQEGKSRVDIDIESDGGMKDFMIEREATRFETDVTYITSDGIRFAISEPESPDSAQKNYIKTTMDNIFAVVKSGDREAIEAAVDIPSFTRYYLLNELLKTVDFDFSSVFFYYKDKKLFAGPAWDYDLAAGNSNKNYSSTASDAADPEGLFAAARHFYKYLCACDWFNDEIRNTYIEYCDYIANIPAEGGLMDSLLSEYGEVFGRNWSDAGWTPSKWWVNVQRRPDATYDENVSYMRKWLSDRNDWLSEYYKIFSKKYILGDADGDGNVNILDATKIQRLLADLIYDEDGMIALRGSVYGEELNILHATLIQRWIADFEVPYPIGTTVYRDL